MDRRTFIQTVGAAGLAGIMSGKAAARERMIDSDLLHLRAGMPGPGHPRQSLEEKASTGVVRRLELKV